MKIDEIHDSELAALPCIHEGRNYKLHLIKESDLGNPVVIKSLQSSAGENMQERLINEYKQTKDAQLPGVRCARKQIVVGGRPATVLDYIEGETLTESFVKKSRSLENNLEVAVAIASRLNEIHQQHLIHRNLASAHIVISLKPLAVTLIGFGDSSIEGNSNQGKEVLSTSMLDYISPEQSGRTNQLVDHRADLYSLGAVLYELFTGKTVYETVDPAELVYAHLAKKPKSPLELKPSLPKAVSDMVMRLLEKNPDERYQSAYGIMVDLDAALNQQRHNHQIGDMVLGQADYSSLFRWPKHIYGRETESKILRAALQDAETGGVVLISGVAGCGKSALVDNLRPYVMEQGAYFVTGSYESTKRHMPYVGINQAFKQWVDLILSENSEELARWKSELLEVCGSRAGSLVEMLPRLELVVGRQSTASEQSPTQTQQRFHNLLCSFTNVSARIEHPLVLFLDNLQWADQASLHLIDMLLSDSDSQPILFIAAYRDDEIGTQNNLKQLLESFTTRGTKVRTLCLRELQLESVNKVVADTLKIDAALSMPLARMVMEKTGGNPLFVRQLLHSLYDKKLLVFDDKNHSWHWDTAAIQRRAVIDSVAEVMSDNIGELSEATREILAIAACIGIQFPTKLLAAITKLPLTETNERLQSAVTAGLIHRVSIQNDEFITAEERVGVDYVFTHDRVRQASYELLPQKQQRLNHLNIGRLLLSQTPENSLDECVFDIVDQFNDGFKYLNDEAERNTLISLNLIAGRKARRAAAYLSSIRYLSMGIGLLPSDCWKSHTELTIELYIEAVESEYLTANYERAALLSKEVLQHTHDLFVRLRVYELQILFLTAQGQTQASIDAGLEALQELGIILSDKSPVSEQQELVALTGKVKSLERLPAMSDPRHLASLRVLMHLAAPALRTNLQLLESIISKMVLLSVAHGNSPMAAFAYGWYGAILCGSVGGVEAGYRFGQLSLEILRQFNAPELEPRVTLLFNAYVRHWKEPMRDGVFRLQEVFQWGLETGDLEYTGLGAVHHCGYLLFSGWPLESVRRKQQRYLETLEWWRLPFQSELLRIWAQTAANLCENQDYPSRLIGKYFDETKYVPKWMEEKNDLSIFCYLCSRTMMQYLFGDYHAAAASGEEAEVYERAALGLYYRANHSFYYALSLLALNEQRGGEESRANLNLALTHINRLRRWSILAPMSFSHKLALVEAEQAHARGEYGRAIELFNDALRYVRKYDNLMDEALICEREAAFYSTLGRDDLAEISLHNALDNYRSWGAYRKVEELEHRFRPLIQHEPELIDTVAILKASHTLSQEVHLEQLLEKMMRIVLENAGAEKGVLIQKHDDSLMLRAKAAGDSVEILNAVPIDSNSEISQSVVNYVARTLSEVLLADAIRDPTFGVDEYIVKQQVRSLLCMPIIYQGKLSGILYLENNLSSDVFTENRLELLKALTAQAAISIENASLYKELENNISALRKSEEKFRVIFDQAFQFIGVLDVDGTLLQANKSSLQFAGINEDDVIGKPFWDTPWWSHSSELKQKLKDGVEEALKGEMVRFEATHISPDGNVGYIDFSLKPVKDSEGNVVLLIPEGRDITELKQAEEEVLLMSFALDNVKEAAFLIDKSAHFRFVNDGACRSLGYTREELLELSVSDLDPEWPEERWPDHWRDLQHEHSLVFESSHQTKDGRIFPVEISANYFQYGDEDYNLALVRDITERKLAEDEIKQYRDSLEEKVELRTEDLRLARDAADTANKAKSTFLANMSHELRTPLNSILGFSNMMQQDQTLNEGQIETLDIINRSGEHLLKLINDVLEIAKIEAGRVQLEISTVDLHALSREVSDMMRLRAQQKGLSLELEQSVELPRYIKSDEARLRQIMVNLLGNAVKFTPAGKITLRLKTKENKKGHLIIEVADTGPGISKDDQHKMFRPFIQLTSGAEQGGTGLGLSLVQQYVELMDGDVSLQSELGEGTTFCVELPLEVVAEEAVTREGSEIHKNVVGLAPDQNSYRILVAEDQQDNQLLLVKLMADINMEVKTANNGKECIEIFKEWKPDLIWMDRLMPVMDGAEATNYIRELPDGDDVKIVIVTASVFKEQEEYILGADIDGFVHKPYHINEIYDCMAQLLDVKFIYSEPTVEQAEPILDAHRISQLPHELQTELCTALESLHSDTIDAAIQKVIEYDSELADTLSKIAGALDYQTILNALKEGD